MIELTEDDFHRAVAEHPMVAVVFAPGAPGGGAPALAAVPEGEPGSGPWLWGRVDTTAAPGLARMFGISDRAPTLVILRERIVLYCAPIGATGAPETAAILARAARLDMAAVRREIEQERLARSALLERRVCPTARRLS